LRRPSDTSPFVPDYIVKKKLCEMRGVYRQVLEKMGLLSRHIPSEAYDEDPSSVKSKDRTTLGTVVIDEAQIVFEPKSDIVFTVDIPPARAQKLYPSLFPFLPL